MGVKQAWSRFAAADGMPLDSQQWRMKSRIEIAAPVLPKIASTIFTTCRSEPLVLRCDVLQAEHATRREDLARKLRHTARHIATKQA